MRMIFAAIVAAILFSAPATAQTKVRKTAFEVVPAGRSHDGDGPVYFYAKDTTGHFAVLFSIRGEGWDAPEVKWPNVISKGQPGAEASTAALADLLGYGADSALLKNSRYFVDTLKKRDTYGRIVGSIWRVDEDGATYDVGYQMVNQGWAWYTYGSGLPRSVEKLYSAAEKKARQMGRGVFDTDNYPTARDPRWWKGKYGYGNNFQKKGIWPFKKKISAAHGQDG